MRRAARDPRVISFAGGLPASESFPRAALARAARDAVLDLRADPLQYHWSEGRSRLREQLGARLRARGADVVDDEIVLTNGAQDALALAIDVLRPRTIHVGPESYPAALDLFRARGATPRNDPRLTVHYVMPALSNPYGRALTEAERAVTRRARWIIEDDAYADLRFEGPPGRPLLAEARDRVLYVGTFSKTLSPGLRVGYLVPPRGLLARARDENARRDLHAGSLAQAIVERVLDGADFEARLVRLRRIYARRCARLVAALRAARIPDLRFTPPEGGFAIWAETTREGDDLRLLERALRAGVAFDPGSGFRPDDRRGASIALRLSFSLVPVERMDEGVARLARVLRRA